MDFLEASNLFRSELVENQLTALRLIYQQLESGILPNEEFLSALIESGLSCEKSALVRELSFRSIHCLYTFKLLRWSEVRAAVVTEMGTVESTGCLHAALTVLSALPDSLLVTFVGSKDSMSVIKSCCLAEDVNVSAVAVEALAPLLLRVWCLLDRTPHLLEGLMQFESTADSRRYQEDVTEFILDLYKNFSLGVKGEALGMEQGQHLVDNTRSLGASASAMAQLLQAYNACCNSAVQGVESYVTALLGQLPASSIGGSLAPSTGSVSSANYAARSVHLASLTGASLSSLIQKLVPNLLEDPYHLFSRATGFASSGATVVFLSQLMLTLLDALPASVGSLSLQAHSLTFAVVNTFAFDENTNEEETAKSRSAQLSLNVLQLAEEWLRSHLLSLLRQPVGTAASSCELVHLTLLMLQYSPLAHLRAEIYPILAESIFRILQNATTSSLPSDHPLSDSDEAEQHPAVVPYDQLLSWALLISPYLSDTLLTEQLPHIMSFIEYFVIDDVSRTKLFAEFAYVLLVDSFQGSVGKKCIRSPALLQHFLQHPAVATSLNDDDNKYANITTRERLVTSMCSLIDKMLPLTIARFVSAHRSSSLLPSTLEEFRKTSNTSSLPDSTSSMFGNDSVIDLFPTTSGADNLQLTGQLDFNASSSSSSSFTSGGYSGLLSGLGGHMEVPGSSLRTLQPRSDEVTSPAEIALEECHRLVAAGLLISRAAQKCILWRSDGLAGLAAHFSYLAMLQSMAEILTPLKIGDIQNSKLFKGDGSLTKTATDATSAIVQSYLYMSLQWARGAYTDLVLSLLTLLAAPLLREAGAPSAVLATPHCTLLPFVNFMGQYMHAMFGNTNIKAKQDKLLLLMEHLLIQRGVSQACRSRAGVELPPSGLLGGDELNENGATATDSSVLSPLQLKSLECLENLVFHNVELCPEVLTILKSFETLIVQEAKNSHQQVNPLVDQRVRQAYRRVQLQAVASQQDPLSVLSAPSVPSLPVNKSLDVSFKTSLVASYHRSSYTGTGTEGVEGSWLDWVKQRQKNATASGKGGILDDILRVMPSSIASNTASCLAADTSLFDSSGLLSFGAFSEAARACCRQEKVKDSKVSSSVCTADILGLMNDVHDSHLCCPSSEHLAQDFHSEDLDRFARDIYTLTDDLSWQVVSGSSDILTVLAAISYSLLDEEITISVRVINSAMFKIPNFSLQVCLQIATSKHAQQSESDPVASFLDTSTPVVQEGVEYCLPGTIVDRQFTFRFHRFGKVSAVVRVIYPDLVVDLKSVEVFETIPLTEGGGDENSESVKKNKYKESDVCKVAHIDCVPVSIPLVRLLLPYGLGSFSSMMSYRHIGRKLGGIPLEVYQAAKARLTFTKQSALRAPLIAVASRIGDTSLADEVSRAVYVASKSLHCHQESVMSMDSRVRLDNFSCQRLSQISASLAWCLQTWWGSELVISMTLSQCSLPATATSAPPAAHVFWFGHVEVLSSDPSIVETLQKDLPALIVSLTAGRITIASTNLSSSHSSSSINSSHWSPDFTRSLLPPQAYLESLINSRNTTSYKTFSSQQILERWNTTKNADALSRKYSMDNLYDRLYSGLYSSVPSSNNTGEISFL